MFKSGIRVSILLASALAFQSCEKDDLCGGLNVKTPLVNIEFYNKDNISQQKAPEELVCYAVGHENEKKNFILQSKISLPLQLSGTRTQWVLEYRTIVNNDTIIRKDTLNLSYETQSEYISKACGYRSIFNNVTTSINNNTSNQPGEWIVSLESMNQIINENDIHVKILF